jgi:hypothetical protein
MTEVRSQLQNRINIHALKYVNNVSLTSTSPTISRQAKIAYVLREPNALLNPELSQGTLILVRGQPPSTEA